METFGLFEQNESIPALPHPSPLKLVVNRND